MGDPEPDDLLGGFAVDALSFEAHAPGRLHHAADRAQRGGLARAVGAEDRGDAAGLDGEAQAVEDLGGSVLGLQVLGLEQRGH